MKNMVQKGLPGGSFKPLSDESISKVHQTAMRVIEEVGFEVDSEAALGLFETAGGKVDREKHRVRLTPERVQKLIRMAPSEVRLCGQDERHDIHLGGKRVYAGTGGVAFYIYHPDTNEKQLATLEDLKRLAKLVDQLENIHLFMLPIYPNELPAAQVDVNRFFAGLDNTAKHVMGGVYTRDGARQVIQMAEMVAGSQEALKRSSLISMVICGISPMKMDEQYADILVAIAKAGIPVVCSAGPLSGATSPVTLAGTLAIQTVDSLMGVMLTQIVNPGTPVIIGSVASTIDFGGLRYLSGAVEMGLLNAAGAQIAQSYQLPYYGTGGMTDAKVLDSQSGYESAITSLLCALAGANFIHNAAGLMESGLTACYEKFVIDNEILGMVMRAVEGIGVDDDTLALDLIKQVGPGGNFIAAAHTRQFMNSEHYQPALSDRSSREEWEAKGKKTTWQKAAAMIPQLIANHTYRLPDLTRRRVLSEIPGIVD